MRKPAASRQRRRARERTAKRNRVSYLDLPSALHGERRDGTKVTRMRVEVFAAPSGPYTPEKGYGEIKRGVYISIRGTCDGWHNHYAVLDSQRRNIGVITDVPEQPTGWSARNDTGAPHREVARTVLHEAWKMLSRADPNGAPKDEPSTLAVYRGYFPYSADAVTHDGQLAAAHDTVNEASRSIRVVRDDGAVEVTLEQYTGPRNYVELSIGGKFYKDAKGIAPYEGDGSELFFVADVRALEQLRDAIGTAISMARDSGWPYEPPKPEDANAA